MNDPQAGLLAFYDPNDLPSFVVADQSSFTCFSVQSTGVDSVDNGNGERAALEALACAKKHNSAACIAFAVASIADSKRIGLVEAGFINRIAIAAMAGSMN